MTLLLISCAFAFCTPTAGAASEATLASATGIPTPAAVLIDAPCPDMSPEATSSICSYTDGRVYLPAGSSEFAREHELGTAFNAQYLSDGERNKATWLLGFPVGVPWDSGTGTSGFHSPLQRFEDAYAACRLQLDPDSDWETGYDYFPTRREFRSVCGFIRRASR